MAYTYTPRGVCSRHISFDLEDGIVKTSSLKEDAAATRKVWPAWWRAWLRRKLSGAYPVSGAGLSPPPAPTSSLGRSAGRLTSQVRCLKGTAKDLRTQRMLDEGQVLAWPDKKTAI